MPYNQLNNRPTREDNLAQGRTMPKRAFLLIAVLFIPMLFMVLPVTFAESSGETAESIIAKSEKLARGESSYGIFEMQIKTPRWKRTVEMEAWSKGNDKSFIAIRAPKKDKGITFLRIKNEMWQYIPKIEKIIKIPPSMMMQSWMGSDITNDDMVRESSLEIDYTKQIIGETEEKWTLELTPKPGAPVVWEKIITEVQKNTYITLKAQFYDEEGKLVRTIIYDTIKKMGDRTIPTRMIFVPETGDKKGNETILLYKTIRFNINVPETLFSIRSLKRKSR